MARRPRWQSSHPLSRTQTSLGIARFFICALTLGFCRYSQASSGTNVPDRRDGWFHFLYFINKKFQTDPSTDSDCSKVVITTSKRSEPSSRNFLIGEQPNPWKLLHLQDKLSRHRGAELRRRYGRLGATSLLSPG